MWCIFAKIASMVSKSTTPTTPAGAPRSLAWKLLAKRLKTQRDALQVQSDRQRRLLVWILNQIVLERSAAIQLEAWDSLESPTRPRGQA